MIFMRNGLRLAVHQSAQTGIPVIFQHGLCGSAAQTVEAFPDDPRFRLLTLECRGHGASDAGPHEAFSIATFAEDLAAFIKENALGSCIVGGISMGAAIALYLAVHHKPLVQALVLARPAWLTQSQPQNILPNLELGNLLQDHAPAIARQHFEASPTAQMLAKTAPDNLASLRSFLVREPASTTAALLTAIASSETGVTENELCEISMPTLIIGHERDAIHPFALAQHLGSLIPAARLAKITPKATDKQGYITDFHRALLQFFNEVHPQ